MQSSFSLCDLPWWAVLLSWLMPAVLGYFWGMLQWSRYKSKSKKAEMELSSASKRIVNLEKEVNECRLAYEKVAKEKEKLVNEKSASSQVGNKQVLGSTPSQAASSVVSQDIIHETKPIFGYAIRRNDIKIVEGIDPKIEKILTEVGITDWNALETADTNYISSVLNDAGYHHANPSSWPYQASLARLEKWEELKEFQSKL
jgi:predicted flap endonuclease-1-like 5' DNA nuclease